VQLLLNVAVLITICALGLRLQRIMWRPRSRAEQPAAGSALSASGPSAEGSGSSRRENAGPHETGGM